MRIATACIVATIATLVPFKLEATEIAVPSAAPLPVLLRAIAEPPAAIAFLPSAITTFEAEAFTPEASAAGSAAEPADAQPTAAAPSPEAICDSLVAAAKDNDLPVLFFLRLIWHESRFDPLAVSRAGALGVAQFMPRIASAMGLADPFDPIQALPVSARFLRTLREQFGNLALAAAAYNAGSKRIQDWLAKRGRLPQETRAYVARITGLTPERWAKTDDDDLAFKLPPMPCRISQDVLARNGAVPLPIPRPHETKNTAGADVAAAAKPPAAAAAERTSGKWGVQISAGWSEDRALRSFEQVRRRHPALLAKGQRIVLRGKNGKGPAVKTRVRLVLDTRSSADEVCMRLKRAGGACSVLRN